MKSSVNMHEGYGLSAYNYADYHGVLPPPPIGKDSHGDPCDAIDRVVQSK